MTETNPFQPGPPTIIDEGFPTGWHVQDWTRENVTMLCVRDVEDGTKCICVRPMMISTDNWVPIARAIALALAPQSQMAAHDAAFDALNHPGIRKPQWAVTREKVVAALKAAGPQGLTNAQLQAATGMSYSLVSQATRNMAKYNQIRQLNNGNPKVYATCESNSAS